MIELLYWVIFWFAFYEKATSNVSRDRLRSTKYLPSCIKSSSMAFLPHFTISSLCIWRVNDFNTNFFLFSSWWRILFSGFILIFLYETSIDCLSIIVCSSTSLDAYLMSCLHLCCHPSFLVLGLCTFGFPFHFFGLCLFTFFCFPTFVDDIPIEIVGVA